MTKEEGRERAAGATGKGLPGAGGGDFGGEGTQALPDPGSFLGARRASRMREGEENDLLALLELRFQHIDRQSSSKQPSLLSLLGYRRGEGAGKATKWPFPPFLRTKVPPLLGPHVISFL